MNNTLSPNFAQALAGRVLESAGQQSAGWLKTPEATLALRQALLRALATTVEHLDLAGLPLLDENFLQQTGTADIVARLLLTADPRDKVQEAQAVADLTTAWQGEDRDQQQVESIAGAFLEFLDASLAAQSDDMVAQKAERQQAIQGSLANLRALLLWQQAAAPAPPTSQEPASVRLVRQLGPGRSPNRGELGALSQRPLVQREAHGAVLYVGSHDGVIHALDVASGQARWQRSLPGGYLPPAAFAAWREFLLVAPQAESPFSPSKELLLLARENGAIAHAISLPARQMSAPVVDGDHAYLMGQDGALLAVDLAAGALAWSAPTDAAFSPYPPARAGGALLLPASDPILRCMDLATRQERWRVSAAGDTPYFMHTPLVHEGEVYAANWNGCLYAIELESGALRWVYAAGRTLDQTPTLAGDLILAAGYDHRLHAVDRRTGQARWIGPDLGRRIYSRPVVAGRGAEAVVYVAPFRRTLHALRLVDGQPIWPAALAMEDRARGDLALVDGQVIAPGRDGKLHFVSVAKSAAAASVEELLAAGDWPLAALRLAQEGQPAEAARLYAGRGLLFRAAELYQQAGRLEEAARAYAGDEHFPPAWRQAAALFHRLKRPEEAARQWARAGDWPAAAQAWEEAGRWAEAAAIYVQRLNEPGHAAQLYQRAGQPEEAARLYEQAGDYTQAIRILEEADVTRYAPQVQRLRIAAIQHGSKEHLTDALALASDSAKRAELLTLAGEWTQAAQELAGAGDWQAATALLLAHKRVERALELLLERPEAAAQLQAGGLLGQAGRWAEALSVYERCLDLPGQAECCRQLGNLEQAAALYAEAARQAEAPRLTDQERARVAGWFALAAQLYRQSFRHIQYTECRRKVHLYRRLPWLIPQFVKHPESKFMAGRPTVLGLHLLNDGAGPARNVQVELADEQGIVTFTGFRVIDGIAPLDSARQWVQVEAARAIDCIVRVRLSWDNPDGEYQSIELQEPWVLSVEEAAGLPQSITVQGDWVQANDIVYGNLYRDQAYHQEGDRTEIRRGRAGEEWPPVGKICPQCNTNNPTSTKFCDRCGGEFL
jgi:outer membrane protein assembly factor BamB